MAMSNEDSRVGPVAAEGSKPGQVKDEAISAAHDVRDEVAGAASEVKDEVASQVGNVKDEALAKTNDLIGQAREQVATQADQGTRQLADTLVSAGRELTAMAERSEQSDGPMTAVVRQIGTRATEMGEHFGSGGYRALAGDTSRFARSSPGLFLLVAAGAGFAVGRIIRNADTKAIASAARDGGEQVDDRPAPSMTPTTTASLPARSPARPGDVGAESAELAPTARDALDRSSGVAIGEA